MLPEGWVASTVGDHAEILTGHAFKSDRYTDDAADIRLLRGDNVTPGSLRWRDAKRWPVGEATSFARYDMEEGDFVIAMDRTWVTGGVKVAEVRASDLPCLLVQRVARLRARPSIQQSLLRHHFSGHRFGEYVKKVQTETAVPHISPADIREYPIPVPPPDEQKGIAEVLDTWDQAIETVDKLIDNARARKQALMQQLLTGKRRLPGFEGGHIERPLTEVTTIKTGDSNKQDSLADGPYTFFDRSTEVRRSQQYLFDTEAVIVGGEGQEFIPKYFAGKFDLHQRAYAIQGFDRCFGRYIFHLVNHQRHLLRRFAVGSTVPSLRMASFEKIPVPMLELGEQQAIAEILDSADLEVELLCNQKVALKTEKRALMRQLLTGKRRVKVEEAA